MLHCKWQIHSCATVYDRSQKPEIEAYATVYKSNQQIEQRVTLYEITQRIQLCSMPGNMLGVSHFKFKFLTNFNFNLNLNVGLLILVSQI